jgi:uncharacterized membrane protein YfcA
MAFLVGILIGMTSMGGAALMAPFLILAVKVPPVAAVRVDLIYSAVTKIVGSLVHWKQDTIDFRAARQLAMGSVPGGLLGTYCVALLPRWGIDANREVKRAIGIMLVLVAVTLIARMFVSNTFGMRFGFLQKFQGPGAVAYGAFVGFCVGMTSVGSGTLIVPFLLAVYPLAPSKVVGTDVFHAALLVSATGLAHWSNGPVDWGLVAQLLAGSVPGVILGSWLAPKVPAKALRTSMALVLLVLGIKMT